MRTEPHKGLFRGNGLFIANPNLEVKSCYPLRGGPKPLCGNYMANIKMKQAFVR